MPYPFAETQGGGGFESDPFAETQGVGGFESDPFANAQDGSRVAGDFATDPFAETTTEGGTSWAADPFGNTPSAGTEGATNNTGSWQEVSDSSGFFSDGQRDFLAFPGAGGSEGAAKEVSTPRAHKEPENSDLSEDEVANRRYGKLYQEIDTEKEEVPTSSLPLHRVEKSRPDETETPFPFFLPRDRPKHVVEMLKSCPAPPPGSCSTTEPQPFFSSLSLLLLALSACQFHTITFVNAIPSGSTQLKHISVQSF